MCKCIYTCLCLWLYPCLAHPLLMYQIDSVALARVDCAVCVWVLDFEILECLLHLLAAALRIVIIIIFRYTLYCLMSNHLQYSSQVSSAFLSPTIIEPTQKTLSFHNCLLSFDLYSFSLLFFPYLISLSTCIHSHRFNTHQRMSGRGNLLPVEVRLVFM